jgi:hypothetical protein
MGQRAAVERPFSQDHWESEKEEARLIQQSLLPTGSLQGSSFEISYNFSPYAEVGGDFADFSIFQTGALASTWATWRARDSLPRCTRRW